MSYLNQLIGNYKITRLIKSGGMADVYEGIDIYTAEKVAVKILKSDFKNDQDVVRRFYIEGAVLEKFDHPNIVKFLFNTDIDRQPVMVMEYLEGYDMNELMQKQPVIDYKLFRNYFLQVLDAIIYAHSKGVVHRDIKPSNIFITNDGVVKLLDFGIVKIMTNTNTSNTTTGYGMLTPAYMSPEQATYSKNINEKTDIYSLGVTMYSVLNGKNPYEGMTAFEIGGQVLYKSLPELPNHEALNKVIAKATHKNQENRYQTANEFKGDMLQLYNQCSAFNINGKRCENTTTYSARYCYLHIKIESEIGKLSDFKTKMYASPALADIIGKTITNHAEAIDLVIKNTKLLSIFNKGTVSIENNKQLLRLFNGKNEINIHDLSKIILLNLSFKKLKIINSDELYSAKEIIDFKKKLKHIGKYYGVKNLEIQIYKANIFKLSIGDLVYVNSYLAKDGIYCLSIDYCILVKDGLIYRIESSYLSLFYILFIFILLLVIPNVFDNSNYYLILFIISIIAYFFIAKYFKSIVLKNKVEKMSKYL